MRQTTFGIIEGLDHLFLLVVMWLCIITVVSV